MALLHWRKFMFFDEEYVVDTELNQLVCQDEPKDVIDLGQPFISVQVSCSSSGRGNILLGDTNGYVYIINRYLKVNSFRANQKLTSHIKQVPKLATFITCGSDQSDAIPLIKLWNPEKTDRLNQPTCIRVIRANSGFNEPTPITCIDCNDVLTLMAVGYRDGSIVLFHGDISKNRRSKLSRSIKISNRPIINISIIGEIRINQNFASTSYLGQTNSQLETTAFIATDEEIFYTNLSEKSFSKKQLDLFGSQHRCSCLLSGTEGKANNENLFAVGRADAVYFYQIDGRGPCLAFDGEKLILQRFKSYLVIISRDSRNINQTRRGQTNERITIESKRVNLNIYDIKNKYIAHSSVIPEVLEIVSEWGQLFVICKNGQIMAFREKDTHTKLETLIQKNQFSLVIDLAKSHQYNEDALTEIFKHYGDHLYRKGDYEGAICQYIKTIGRSEPSYVIKKFLNSKRMSNLTVYLEALHEKSHASHEHTKLLLYCYSKLRNDQQLKHFIESYEEGNIRFDVDIAIKVLRDAGFYELALYLAKKHQKHEWFFKVQLEDTSNSEAAVEYMNEMDNLADMVHYMKKYGRTMLKDAPKQTISTIKTICMRSREEIKRTEMNTTSNLFTVTRQIYPEEFFHIFVNHSELFVQLLEQLVEDGTEFATKAVHNLLLELYLNAWRKEKDILMKNPYADKIKNLLSHSTEKFDLDQALILCRNNRFDEGLIDLYSRTGLYHLVLQYYIDQEDSLKIMKTCEQFGSKNPNLYNPALIYYSKTGDERLSQILKAIEHHELIPPMVVMDILFESKRASLGSVKEYLLRFGGKINDKIMYNENSTDRYEQDTDVVRNIIEKFEFDHISFNLSKCSACQNPLDLPSVHFLCTHSYHQNCFYNYSAETDECPICVTTNRKLQDDIGSHETSKSTLEKLEKQLTTPSDDVFNILAELYGYGLFN